MKIVSLLPAATEIVCALGLRDQLAGVSHECEYPESVRVLPKVTRSLLPPGLSSRAIDQTVRQHVEGKQPLYGLDVEALHAIEPDLIITQALCDVCAVAEADVNAAACALPRTPRVLNLEPRTLTDVFESMRLVADAAGVSEAELQHIVQPLRARVEAIAILSSRALYRPRVAFLEWLDPFFSCGHWNPEIVYLAGGLDGFGAKGEPATPLKWSELLAWQPEVVFVACCGFNVRRTMRDLATVTNFAAWNDLPAVRQDRVFIADGSRYFSSPSPRLVDSLALIAHALHPEVHALPNDLVQVRGAPALFHLRMTSSDFDPRASPLSEIQ